MRLTGHKTRSVFTTNFAIAGGRSPRSQRAPRRVRQYPPEGHGQSVGVTGEEGSVKEPRSAVPLLCHFCPEPPRARSYSAREKTPRRHIGVARAQLARFAPTISLLISGSPVRARNGPPAKVQYKSSDFFCHQRRHSAYQRTRRIRNIAETSAPSRRRLRPSFGGRQLAVGIRVRRFQVL